MKSRTVGFFLPLVLTTPSRIESRPENPASSRSDSGSSMPFSAKSKLSPSESSASASISSGRVSEQRHLVLGRRLRLGRDAGEGKADRHGVGIAAGALGLASQGGIGFPAVRQVRGGGEDHLAPAPGKAAAAAALSRLDDDGMALRRARHGEGAARAEIRALVVEPPHFVRIGEAAAFLVHFDGTVVPRIPMAEDHFHELVGAVVAQIVLHHRAASHVHGFAVVERGDHVPRRAPVRHQVDGGEEPRHVERLVIRGRVCRAEAEPRRSPLPIAIITGIGSILTQRMPCSTAAPWSLP